MASIGLLLENGAGLLLEGAPTALTGEWSTVVLRSVTRLADGSIEVLVEGGGGLMVLDASAVAVHAAPITRDEMQRVVLLTIMEQIEAAIATEHIGVIVENLRVEYDPRACHLRVADNGPPP